MVSTFFKTQICDPHLFRKLREHKENNMNSFFP